MAPSHTRSRALNLMPFVTARGGRWTKHRAIRGAFIVLTAALSAGPLLAQRPVPTPAKPASALNRAINFSPITRQVVVDGFPTPMNLIRDGDHYIRVNVPNGWRVGGSPNEIHFDSTTMPGALITIRSSSLTPPDKFDDPWIETTRPLLLGSLPKDGKNGKIVNVTPNALNIAGWTSIEFKLNFENQGRDLQVNDWMFLKLSDGRLLEVIVTGKEKDFPALRTARDFVLAGWGLFPASEVK